MFVLDAHEDIAFLKQAFNRDYRQSALKKRQLELGTSVARHAGRATIGLPEALAGRVGIVFATIYVSPYVEGDYPWNNVMYKDAATAYKLGMQQLDYYHQLADEDDRIRLIYDANDLDAVLATWAPGKDIKDHVQGIVILMENADPIIEPQQFEEWYERGVRLVGPAWRATRYSAGTGAPGGLTALGHELLEVMAGFNAILDLSHMAEDAYLESLDRYEGVIIASHSNPRKFCNTDRHLSDEMIRRLAERDGVIGVVLANFFLDDKWHKNDPKSDVTLSTALDAIDMICQITGSAQHVGIGSDFDGGFGQESIPAELDTVADLWRFKDGLANRGFSEDDIEAILSGNMLRKLRESLSN